MDEEYTRPCLDNGTCLNDDLIEDLRAENKNLRESAEILKQLHTQAETLCDKMTAERDAAIDEIHVLNENLEIRLQRMLAAEHREGEWRDFLTRTIGSNSLEHFVVRWQEMTAELAALRERERWIPVKEQMPPERAYVLALAFGHHIYQTIWAMIDGNPYWEIYGGRIYPTHWRPLPEPPQAQEAGE